MAFDIPKINMFQQQPLTGVGAIQGGNAQAMGGAKQNPQDNNLSQRIGNINGEITPQVDKPGLRTLGFA